MAGNLTSLFVTTYFSMRMKETPFFSGAICHINGSSGGVPPLVALFATVHPFWHT
jgi:hypothetical protein